MHNLSSAVIEQVFHTETGNLDELKAVLCVVDNKTFEDAQDI